MAFEYLAEYATFESVADMDKSVEDHITAHYYNLTESERAIVIALSKRSLAFPGASHLKAETIANALEISTKTVYRSIKKLVELGIIEKVASTKLNGIKGASIYRILPFDDNVLSTMSERENAHTASNDAVCHPQNENQSLNSFNLLSSKQANNNLCNLENELTLQAEKKKEYMNEWQAMLFDFMHSLPFADQLKDQLHKVVLASNVNNVTDFVRAKNVLFKIAMDIKDGLLTVTSTLRAVFVGAYNKAVERSSNKRISISSVEDKAHSEQQVVFYDWLNERESYTPIVSNVVDNNFIPNWLEW